MNVIRLANEQDLLRLGEIYASARRFMHTHGNPNQWLNSYPTDDDLRHDIAGGWLYAMEDDETRTLYGAFALIGGNDPTYAYIEGGSWISDTPYATIHRIAGDGSRRGIFHEAVDFARTLYDHLWIDTHTQNLPMQRAILREGFTYRGVIYLLDGDPRNAYEWKE